MKILKKAVSALLASIMCIPSGVISMANAAENEGNTATTVTLTDTENGLMQFSEECMENSTAEQTGYQMIQINDDGEAEQIENDGSIWAFNKGDSVEVELIPDNGYEPSSFTIKNSDGDIMAQKSTSDNVFSFMMPDKSISVEVAFVKEGSVVAQEKPELTDKDAIALQERIDVLPEANDYYDDDFQSMSLDKREEFDKEVEDIRKTYFDIFSDEQRAQVDASKLFTAIIRLTSFADDSKKELSEKKAGELKKRIEALLAADEIAEPITTDSDTGYAICNYNGENTEMEISDKEADALFIEVSELTEEVSGVDFESLPITIDISSLVEMQDFFTSGSGITMLSMARAASTKPEDQALAGTYNTNWDTETNKPLGGTYYSDGMNNYQSNNWRMKNKLKNTETGEIKNYNSIAYCACAERPRESSSVANKAVKFKKDRIARLTYGLGGTVRSLSNSGDPWSEAGERTLDGYGNSLMIRMILWYGEGGPGSGKDGMVNGDNGKAYDYGETHTALSYVYSGQVGTPPNGSKWKEFYNRCARRISRAIDPSDYDMNDGTERVRAARDFLARDAISPGTLKDGTEVSFEDFAVYVIVPKESTRFQHIFFFNVEGGEDRDPFNLFIYKVNSSGKSISNSTLAGARFRVDYYEDEYDSAEAARKKKPDASYEFETRAVGQGSDEFQVAAIEYDAKFGIDFWPKDKDASTWKNNFLVVDDADMSYAENFGEPGTYVIYEISSPHGYDLAGKMYYSDDDTASTSALTTGLAVTYHDDGIYSINGVDAGKDPSIEAEQNAVIVDEIPYKPDMGSKAVFPSTGQQYANPHATVEIRDDIWVKTIEEQEAKYTVTTKVLDLTTNSYLNVHWTWNGKQNVNINSDSITTTFNTRDDGFTPGERYPYYVTGTIQASGLDEHKIVFINTLVCKEYADGSGSKLWSDITSSKTDLAETLSFISGNTSILSNETGRKGNAGESIIPSVGMQTLTDTVNYTGLIPDRTYTVKGRLIDCETGNLAVDKSGTPIYNTVNTEEHQSSPTGNGSWQIQYTFDATNCRGRKYVSYVDVYLDDELIFSYNKKDDSSEAFFIPSITTKLISNDTGTDITYASKTITLQDTISYSGFLPGATYKIDTELIDMSTGKTLLDANNNPVTATTTRQVTNTNGTFTIPITFAGSNDENTLAGKVFVCYETISIEKNSNGSGNWVEIVNHKSFWDKNQRMYIPEITTTAMDVETGKRISYADDTVKILDTVHYRGIRPRYTYTLESELRDAETDRVITDDNNDVQKLTTHFYADFDLKDNQYLTYGDITPKPEGVPESEKYTFKLNASSFAGRTLVVYQKLYIENETGKHLIAEHTDITDEEQTIHIPKIWTNAIDDGTKTNITYMGNGTSIITDTISYENLLVDEQYVVEGVLIDREKTEASGTPVAAIGPDGSACEITSDPFPAKTANGTTKVSFEIDTARYAEQLKTQKSAVFVVYEELKIVKGKEGSEDTAIVASHKDINDAKQTIYMPEITTELLDTGNGTHMVYAGNNVSLTETINYYNMKPLTNYTVKGRLYNMETGKILVDSTGKNVEAEEVKRSNASGTGTWTLTYNFDASKLQGTIAVAFAEVYIPNGENSAVLSIVADHDDYWDTEERIYIPSITTDAMDQKTGENISLAEKTMKIIDTVHYKSLSTGYTYRLVSELIDQATGEVVTDNAGITQRLTTYFSLDWELEDKQYLTSGDFVPRAKDSDATFEVDAEYFAGRTLVVYQTLYLDNERGSHKIAEHCDPLDERQTIPVSGISSNAFDLDNFTKTSMAGGRATIIDTVSYNNLVPGWTYELQGYVVDKYQTIKAGTNVTVTGTDGKPAKNSITFTPSTSSGTVRIAFEIDTTKYATEEYMGAVVVVYQELYVVKRYDAADDRLLVATHTDIGNLRQTIYIPYIWTDLSDYKTGTKVLNAERDAHIQDTVSYTRFQPNSSYIIKGRIIDMETGKTLVDSSNNTVEIEKEVVTSDTGTGSWTLDYRFDASGLQGKVLVAYEEIYVRNGERSDVLNMVAAHKNFWDKKHRVYIPLISTVATDQKTNSHVTYAEDNVWITDRIYYSHLPENTEYRLVSKLVDKETGEVVRGERGEDERK